MRLALPALSRRQSERSEAWERADGLLRDSLTQEQYDSYLRRGFIDVSSTEYPGRSYRVDGWRPVAVFEDGRFVGAVCIRPGESLPAPDVVLARKLLIEAGEGEFLRAGNWLSPAWRPASAAPSLLLMLLLLLPWLGHLVRLGGPGLLLAGALLAVPGVMAVRRRRARGAEAALDVPRAAGAPGPQSGPMPGRAAR